MAETADMIVYRVGGSVRDELLGLRVSDRDWVVVGQTPESMIAAGFQPVGKDFPVFLHPVTHEEYALARTERKTAPGYKGFSVHFAPGVTLEEDLARRDLTVNAIAIDAGGRIVDPFDGRRDLAARLLRHVSDAFAEDPLRILRVARFCARFVDFQVAPETMALMRRMVAAGEAAALVPERVWQEWARGLMEARPSRMFAVLQDCDALAVLAPDFAALPEATRAAALQALDRAAAGGEADLAVRTAIVFADTGPDAARTLAVALRLPNQVRDLLLVMAEEIARQAPAAWLDRLAGAPAEALLALLERLDAWRRPGRLDALLRAMSLRAGTAAPHAGAERLRYALEATSAIDQGAIARRHPGQPDTIRSAIRDARLATITGLQPAPPPGAG